MTVEELITALTGAVADGRITSSAIVVRPACMCDEVGLVEAQHVDQVQRAHVAASVPGGRLYTYGNADLGGTATVKLG